MKKVLLIHGPNLNMLGKREPEIYGTATLEDIIGQIIHRAEDLDIEIKPFQSNHEGALLDFIQENYEDCDGIIINPGALTHYSYALRDCLAGVNIPVFEVHLSDLNKREEWRRHSVISEVCRATIGGHGIDGYFMALEKL